MTNSMKSKNKLDGASNFRAWKTRINLILAKNKVLDIELVKELPLGLLAGAVSKSTAARVTRRSSCRNPKPLVEAP